MTTNQSSKSPERIRTEQLQERTFLFAKEILDLCPRRYESDPSRVIWRQLIRAAPSASGNLDEADEASSDDDFVYRMKVVLRETKESKRWLQRRLAAEHAAKQAARRRRKTDNQLTTKDN